MFKSQYIEIDDTKNEKFKHFVKRNAKSKEFWDKNREAASDKIDKDEIERLFSQNA